MAFNSGHATTLIAKGAEVVGDITFTGDIEVQGVVKGNIHAKPDSGATLRVVEGGRVEGEIHVPKVIINGEVSGDIHSAVHIELAAKAHVDGSVHYTLIEMVKGAQVNGNMVYANDSHRSSKVESINSAQSSAS